MNYKEIQQAIREMSDCREAYFIGVQETLDALRNSEGLAKLSEVIFAKLKESKSL